MAWLTSVGSNSITRSILNFIVGVALITAFLLALIWGNTAIGSLLPWFQFWILPLVVAVAGYFLGRSILMKAEESEKLKYEFITVATHKLRTPLTRIRWAIPELLVRAGDDAELREGIRRVDDATNRLIELTSVLMEAAHPGGAYDYQQIPVDLRHLGLEALARFVTQIQEKKLQTSVEAEQAPKAYGDMRRLTLVVEVLVENAVMYTPQGGKIHIAVSPDRAGVRFAVTDTGVGVNATDQRNIFSSFYRTNAARTVDTEGVGLGLSLAKSIIERQGGRIGVMSAGEGKGSTFWFTMPAATGLL